MTPCFLFCHQKAMALLFLVLCILSRVSPVTVVEYGQGGEGLDGWWEEKNGSVPVLHIGGDPDLLDRCLYLPLL